MNETNQQSSSGSIDLRQLARATRFAMTGIVLPLCYLSLRASLNIPDSGVIFHDMLGGKPLPALTQFALGAAPFFLGFSILTPIVAIAMLFTERVARSLYVLGIIGFLTMTEFVIVYHALTAPLFEIFKQMGAAGT